MCLAQRAYRGLKKFRDEKFPSTNDFWEAKKIERAHLSRSYTPPTSQALKSFSIPNDLSENHREASLGNLYSQVCRGRGSNDRERSYFCRRVYSGFTLQNLWPLISFDLPPIMGLLEPTSVVIPPNTVVISNLKTTGGRVQIRP